MQDLDQYKLLIVDDDPDFRTIMSLVFAEAGFSALLAESGIQAFEIIKSNKIDVVITDMRMPNGDGLFLLTKIKERDPKNPPVIIVTGYSDISESEFIEKGATKVFPKPFDRKLLIAEVKKSIDSLDS